MECFGKFCNAGTFPSGLKSSFIALISKIAQPKAVSDFRLISLINSIPKLFMKILAERISPHMNKLVGQNQFGFMKGRQASESILIVNEVCHSMSKRKAS